MEFCFILVVDLVYLLNPLCLVKLEVKIWPF